MADAGYLELEQGAEPSTPSTDLHKIYVDQTDEVVYHKLPDGSVVSLEGDGGTVTSVDVSVPTAEFTSAGGPITAAGTIAITKNDQNANTVWAGPSMGPPNPPAFRGLVSDDVPNLDFSKITTGTVPVARGGTNSTTALNNDRVMQSFAGAIVEAPAITANRALISSSSGIPTQSATTSTELAYVSGVTSSIQTQLNGKQASGNYITDLTGDVSATGPGSVPGTVNSVGGSTAANVNTATIAANAATALNTASTIVRRDASGNFAAGTITASLTGSASNNVLKAGDTMTGTLNVPEVILTATNGTGFMEYPRQVSTPATPAAGHGFHLYADSAGKFSWIGENGFTRTFDGTANTANRAYILPDTNGTLVVDPTTTNGDMIYRAGGVLTRLPIGNTNQVLTVTSGLPVWTTSPSNVFGDASDGTVSITGATTLAGPVYYDSLTISGAGSINTNGYPLYCRTLDLSTASANAIQWNGTAGNNSTGSAGGAAPGAGTNAYLGGGGNGTAGGSSTTTTGNQAGAPTAQNPSNGGRSNTSGAGGAGAAGAQAGGAARAGANVSNSIKYGMVNTNALMYRNGSLINGGVGGAGGGGGGGSGTQVGTGGGSGGGAGNNVVVFAQTLITTGSTAAGAISAKGGVGGTAGNAGNAAAGGGGGGSGGGGGYIYLIYQTKTGAAVTNLIDVSGGNGGNGGNGNTTGAGGNGGNGGDGGLIDVLNITTRTGNHITNGTGSAGTAASGATGGTGGAGGSTVFSL